MSVIACYARVAPSEFAALNDQGFDPDTWDEEFDRFDGEGRTADIDQAHEALDAVLRAHGIAVPVVYAGRPVPDTVIGYGPVVLVAPDEVAAAASALASREAETAITADSVSGTAGIGPVDDWASAEGLDYLRTAYRSLAALYTAANASHQLVLMTMQ
ncbi:DUF1877 family protein [Tsukamurella hominis]|uniref:DUF1877 family protein n=1 Tax=Tsukamurella hominis TaxID=1970232 RepID=UPI0039E73B52